MREGKLVEVWNYPRVTLAEIGRYRLDRNGIASEIFGGSVDSYYLTAIGGISLMVREADFQAAKGILESEEVIEDGTVEEKDEISRDAVYCPDCHSKRIRTRKIIRIRSAFFAVDAWKKLFGFNKVFKCRDCKKTWPSR